MLEASVSFRSNQANNLAQLRQANHNSTVNMKFFIAIVFVAFVAVVSAAEESAARKLEPVKEIEPSTNNAEDQSAIARDKRGFVLSAYTAPVAAAYEVAAPAYTAAYTAPVAYTYAAGVPYAYRPYASYYSYPAVYV